MEDLDGKQVFVIGAGVSGRAAALLLARRGASVWLADEGSANLSVAEVDALESLGVDIRWECSDLPDRSWNLAVVSPGVPRTSRLMQQLFWRRVPIISEVELAFRFSKCPVIAVTGTNGKTTTTRLIESILRRSGRKTLVAGNIGRPFCSAVDGGADLDCMVLELSSFQLECVDCFKPKVAVLLNLAPDHLDRHASFDDYCRAKARIFENQDKDDWAILQWEAKERLANLGIEFGGKARTFSLKNPAADVFYDRGLLVRRIGGEDEGIYDCGAGKIIGAHNAENLMAALSAGHALGLAIDEMRMALANFRGEPHRFEVLEPVGGVLAVNDSKATNPDALRAAIESAAGLLVDESSRLWLIAGGLNKRLSFQNLGRLASVRVSKAFLFGRDQEEIRSALGRFTECFLCWTLDKAVRAAFRQARSGDVVLFSPGCASFDQFQDYADRGDQFCSLVDDWRLQQSGGGKMSDRERPQASKEFSVRESDPSRLSSDLFFASSRHCKQNRIDTTTSTFNYKPSIL